MQRIYLHHDNRLVSSVTTKQKLNEASYSRSTTKLNRGERTSSAVGVLQQLLNGDTDRHNSDRVGVGLIEYSAQTLNGLGLCKRGFHGINRLQRAKYWRESTVNWGLWWSFIHDYYQIEIKEKSIVMKDARPCITSIWIESSVIMSFSHLFFRETRRCSVSSSTSLRINTSKYISKDHFVWVPLTLASLIKAQAISSVRRTSPVLRAPLAVKSKRRRSAATSEPLWSASPKTPRRAKFRMCVAVWLLMMGLRRAWK